MRFLAAAAGAALRCEGFSGDVQRPSVALGEFRPDIHLMLLDWEMPGLAGRRAGRGPPAWGRSEARDHFLVASGQRAAPRVRRVGCLAVSRRRSRAAGCVHDDPRLDHEEIVDSLQLTVDSQKPEAHSYLSPGSVLGWVGALSTVDCVVVGRKLSTVVAGGMKAGFR